MKFNKEKKKKNEGGNRGEGSSSSGANKRKWNNNNSSSNNFKSRNSGGKPGETKKRTEACKECGRNHSGACLKGNNVCFNCGQEGHISPNCSAPKRNGCFNCGALDHQARNCPKKNTAGGNRRRGPSGGNLTINGPPTQN